MRVALSTQSGQDILTKKEIARVFSGKFGEFVIVDLIEDLETLDYCACIRTYDIVAVHIEDTSAFGRIVNIIGTLRKKDTESVLVIMSSKEIRDSEKIRRYIEDLSIANISLKIYEYVSGFYDLIKILVSETDQLIEKISKNEDAGLYITNIDFVKNELTLYDDKEKKTYVIATEKSIDFNLILTFLKYGTDKKIPVAHILSSIIREPELTTNSPFEASLSYIRKFFKENFGFNPVYLSGKHCYQFSLKKG